MTEQPTEGIRLQKALAQAGVASRRASEELIADGRVEVNGQIVTEQGTRVDPETDTIRVDGARIPPPRRHLYLVLNKPRGVVSTMDDPQARPDLNQYVPPHQRLLRPGAVALLAEKKQNTAVDYLALQPLYLRAPQAERARLARQASEC